MSDVRGQITDLTATALRPTDIGRREFTKRLFAIGAGFTAAGLLDRVPLIERVQSYDLGITPSGEVLAATTSDLDRIMRRIYSQPLLIDLDDMAVPVVPKIGGKSVLIGRVDVRVPSGVAFYFEPNG